MNLLQGNEYSALQNFENQVPSFTVILTSLRMTRGKEQKMASSKRYAEFRHFLSLEDKWQLMGYPLGIGIMLFGVYTMVWSNFFMGFITIIVGMIFSTYAYYRRLEAKRQTFHAMKEFFKSA
ncbi:MAG: hypothetical protein KBD46_01710 [Candidatus Levybacteria bacterium]|nr:hypothetical protein [Candidatus Levybacteria bacterium]